MLPFVGLRCKYVSVIRLKVGIENSTIKSKKYCELYTHGSPKFIYGTGKNMLANAANFSVYAGKKCHLVAPERVYGTGTWE